MKARLNRISLRDFAVLLTVASAVAVGALLAAREAGIGDGAAVAEGDQLVLTVTPEAGHCVTERAEEYWGIGSGGARQSSGWVVTAEADVVWSVSGGEPPYEIEIDGRTAQPSGEPFSQVSGRSTVACAATSVSWRWGRYSDEPTRYYDSDPGLDSGWKTIRARVRDANGNKAQAVTRLYTVFRAIGNTHLLRGGETYVAFGRLVTIPTGVNMRIGAVETGSTGSGAVSFYVDGSDPFVVIWLDRDTFTELVREVPSDDRSGARGSADYSDSELQAFHAAFDSFADSVDEVPNPTGGIE